MTVAELAGKLNRRHRTALCATLICVGLILLLSHVGIRPVLGIAFLGIAYAWALGSDDRRVHWLLFAFGLPLLLLSPVADGYYWPKTKAELIQSQKSILEGDREIQKIDSDQMRSDDKAIARQAGDSYNHDVGKYFDDSAELGRRQGENLLERELEVEADWGSIVGGLLLLSSGMGLLI